MSYQALHRNIIFVDIAGSRSDERNDTERRHLRDELRRMVEESFRWASVPPGAWRGYERGDAFLFVVDATTPTAHLLDQFVLHLAKSLRDHNRLVSAAGRMSVRAAAHAGEATVDETGASGSDVVITCRLADAEPVREAVRVPGCDLALIVSDDVYSRVIRQTPGVIGPDEFRETHVHVKEYEARAWILTRPSHTGFASAPRTSQRTSETPARGVVTYGGVFFNERPTINAPVAGGDQTFSYGSGPVLPRE